MELSFLLFDATDDDSGACSFDAMASVVPNRVPAVLDEIGTVLRWAWHEFGAPSSADDGSKWDFDLQAVDDASTPLDISFDGDQTQLSLPRELEGRVTISLAITGPVAFAHAFRETFPE